MADARSEALYSLFIISKSGSLLYERDFMQSHRQSPPLSSDERLFLASTFHALEALSSGEIGPSANDININNQSYSNTKSPLPSPKSNTSGSFASLIPPPGIVTLDTSSFRLHCYQTLTGLKFVGIGSPSHNNLESILRNICLIYADYALKNPFYRVGMPIRCELFEEKVAQYISTRQ